MNLKPIEILLVEDSPSDVLIATEALLQARVPNHLHSVDDGVESLAFLRRQGVYGNAPRPDLILLDLNLPRMDGREVLKEIKADPLLKTIPIVILTTSEASDDVIRAYSHHANCYVAKPVDFQRFAEVVRSIENFWFSVVKLPPAPGVSVPPPATTAPARARDENVLRVLHLEDSPSDLYLLQAVLTQAGPTKFDLRQVERLADARAALSESSFDVILTDLGLPDSQGLATFLDLQEAAGGIPIIVLTSIDDETGGIKAVQAGAQDYLVKSLVDGASMARAVRYAIERKRLKSQLLQAQRLEAVGQFAGGIAHDFNHLLSVIGHHSALLLDVTAAPEAAASARQITATVERAAKLIQRMLTFSRQQAVQLRSVDLNEVVGNMANLLSPLLGNGIAVELQLSPELPVIKADPEMVEQVLMNLILNSRDAMPHGGRLSLQTGVMFVAAKGGADPDANPGEYVYLSVGDTGVGIPADILPRIFEPLFTTKEAGKGTGLGLATVYGIVKQHRGWIKVLSESSKGAVFRIHWPVSPGLPAPQIAARPPVPDEDPERPRGGGETILLVEDDDALRHLVRRVLERGGYKVLTARSGAEALDSWQKNRETINLLFTDLLLPGGMSGGELVTILCAERPDLKVIFSSGCSPDRFRKDTVRRPGQHLLPKPYNIQELARMVRNCLDGRTRPAD